MSFRRKATMALATAALVSASTMGTAAAAPASAPQQVSPDQRACGWSGTVLPTISQGSTGSAVGYAQCMLVNLGLLGEGEQDRIFGPRTAAAVVQVQAKCNIAQDGVIGPNTWNCLENL